MIKTNNPLYKIRRVTKDGWNVGSLKVWDDYDLYTKLCIKFNANRICISEDWYQHFKDLKQLT